MKRSKDYSGFLRSVMGARKSGARVGGCPEPESGQQALEKQPQTLHQRGPGGLEHPSAAGMPWVDVREDEPLQS